MNYPVNALDELKRFLSKNDLSFLDIKAGRILLSQREETGIPTGEYIKVLIKDGSFLEGEEDIKNYNYDNSYGIQYVYGAILFKDGRWAQRMEYDGSEWWEIITPPKEEDLLK